MATCGICHWLGRDVKFQSGIVKKGGIPLLASLLPLLDQIPQEYVLSILLDIN